MEMGLIDICVDFDCNNNGLSDRDELASGAAEDCNANCIPDECDLMISLDDYGLGHWRFEESSGSTVIDASLIAMTGPSTQWPPVRLM